MSSTARATVSTVSRPSGPAIIAKAMELIETAGLEALSMRQLGDAFGIKASSLYWYVSGKDNVLDLVADELNRQAAEYLSARKRPCQTATLQLIHLGYLYRGFLHAHPQWGLLLASRLVAGPHRAQLVNVFIEDLVSRHGIPAAEAMAAAAAVRSLEHGCVIEQHARHVVLDPDTGQPAEASLSEFQQAMGTATGATCATGQVRDPAATDVLAEPTDVGSALRAMITGLLGEPEQADRTRRAAP